MPAAVRVRTLIRAVTSMGSPVAGVTVPGLEGSVGFGSVGFVSVGELPYAVFMADTGRNEPGLISYADRTTAPGAWCGEKG